MKKTKNIEVAVRMRPLLDNYQDQYSWIANSQHRTISSIPTNVLSQLNISSNIPSSNDDQYPSMKKRQSKIIQKNNVYEFTYDYVFNQQQRNIQIYEESCKNIVNQFLNGNNGSIFMYGQTTSGKTYTMLGGNEEQGLIIYSLKDIFKYFQSKQKGKKSQKSKSAKINTSKHIYISYMQIYNEQINDLLNSEGTNLKIVDDHAQKLSQYQISYFNQAIQLLQQGQKQRSYAQKSFHDHSSRSHTIFQVVSIFLNIIQKLIQKDINSNKIVSKNLLNLVDLAGSQRVGEQQSNEQTGYINKSLFVLSNVIHKLSQKKSGHIPFRDSKLTRVLSSSLTTSSHTMFICTISPAEINFTQTLSTLRFANQSRKVQLKTVEDSLILNDSSFITQQKQITKLKQQNCTLKKNLFSKQNVPLNKAPISLLERTLEKLEKYLNQQNKQNKFPTCNLKKTSHQVYIISENSETMSKIQNLYSQYKRNVQILQKQYIKAMINLTANDLKIQKQEVKRKVLGDQITL